MSFMDKMRTKFTTPVADVAVAEPSDIYTADYSTPTRGGESVMDLLTELSRAPVASVANVAVVDLPNQLIEKPANISVPTGLQPSLRPSTVAQRQSLRYTLQEGGGGGTILGGAGDTVDDLLQILIEKWPDELMSVMQGNLELYHRP